MENKIYDVLKNVKAEEQLKRGTIEKLYAPKKEKASNHIYRTALSTCAVLMMVLLVGVFSHKYYFAESAYIDIDVNPSIELTINRFNKVIDAYAYNEEGERILDEIEFRYKEYEVVVIELVEEMNREGYLKEDGLLSATLRTDSEASIRLKRLEETVASILENPQRGLAHEVYVIDSDTKRYSHEENLSPAKYLAIQELQKVAPEITIESCRNHSISEIRKETHDHETQKQRHEKEKTDANHNKETQEGGHNQNHNQDTTTREHNQGNNQDGKGQDHNQTVKDHNQSGQNHSQNASEQKHKETPSEPNQHGEKKESTSHGANEKQSSHSSGNSGHSQESSSGHGGKKH